jgi:chitodextrinase
MIAITSTALRGLFLTAVCASLGISQTSLKVQDRSHDNDSPDNQLYAHYQIFNTGTTPVPMSSLTLRYWFTNESPSDPLVFACDYAQVNCSNLTSRFVTMQTPVALADTFVEIGFLAGAGTLAPGQSSGEIQTRVHKTDFLPMITVNDYSFISDPSFVYKDSTTVTLYLNGVLIWGVEPGPGAGDTQAPSVPSGLRVTGTSSTSVSLAWTASTDNVAVTSYDVLNGSIVAGSTAATSFTVTGLASGTSFSFSVRARDAAGNMSAASAPVSAQTAAAMGGDTTPPSVPAGLQVTAVTSNSVSLSWSASSDNVGVTGYDVLNGAALAGNTAGTSFTVTGLAPSTSFSFTVRARDAAGNVSAPSAAAAATTSAATTTASLKVQDRSHDNDSPDAQLYAHYEIFNMGTTAVPMSSLTLRYWFTNENPTDPLVFECDYAQISCANVTSKFVKLTQPAALADTYVEIGFTAAAGSIAAGAQSGEIQTRVHKQDFFEMTTLNDYSFISDTSFVYKDTTTVTLYLNGVLVWGVEPK